MRFVALLFAIITIAGCSSSVRTGSSSSYGGTTSTSGLTQDRKYVVSEAGTWLGTPYRYGGSSKSGTDCSGMVFTVFSKVGVSLPRRARDMYKMGSPVSLKRIIPGDLVFFANTAGKGITHVGIYTGKSKFIHASSSSGVVTSSLSQDYYNKHFAGARKVLK